MTKVKFIDLIQYTFVLIAKQMKSKNIYIIVFSLILVITSSWATQPIALAMSNETTMRIEIDKESFLNPGFLFLDIVIDSATSTFNTVLTSINYDPSMIEIDDIIFDNSFCSIIATSSMDNISGQTSFSCGNPNNNASSTTQIARLKIKKIQEGFTTVRLNNSVVLSADGLANNILDNIEKHTLMIIKEL